MNVLVLLLAVTTYLPPANTPLGVSVRVEPYADPLLRRPLDPKIVPLRCVADVFTRDDADRRMIVGSAEAHLIAGEKKSATGRGPVRTELTCDVSPDGLRAKTAVRVYKGSALATEQMSEVSLPGPRK